MRILVSALVLLAVAGAARAQAPNEVCPKRGGIIRTVDMTLPSVDPAISVDPESYTRLVYDSLIDVLPDLTYRPGLGREMPEQVDPKTYVFHLREGGSPSTTARSSTPMRSSSTSTGSWPAPSSALSPASGATCSSA